MRWCEPGASSALYPEMTISSVLSRRLVMHTVFSTSGPMGIGPIAAWVTPAVTPAPPAEDEDDPQPRTARPPKTNHARTGNRSMRLDSTRPVLDQRAVGRCER